MRMMGDEVPALGPCAVRWLARLFVKAGSPAVYTYNFMRPNSNGLAWHTAEIPFAFGVNNGSRALKAGGSGAVPGPVLSSVATEADTKFAKNMSAYWHTFARTGKPRPTEPAGLPPRPAFLVWSTIAPLTLYVGLVPWPAFTGTNTSTTGDVLLKFEQPKNYPGGDPGGPQIEPIHHFRREACNYWEELYWKAGPTAYLANVGLYDYSHHVQPFNSTAAFGADVVQLLCKSPIYKNYLTPGSCLPTMTPTETPTNNPNGNAPPPPVSTICKCPNFFLHTHVYTRVHAHVFALHAWSERLHV